MLIILDYGRLKIHLQCEVSDYPDAAEFEARRFISLFERNLIPKQPTPDYRVWDKKRKITVRQ